MNFKHIAFARCEFSIVCGRLNYSLPDKTRIAWGANLICATPAIRIGSGRGLQEDPECDCLRVAVSKAIVALRRHGAASEGRTPRKQAFFAFGDLSAIRNPSKGIKSHEADVMPTIDAKSADKMRLHSRWAGAYFL